MMWQEDTTDYIIVEACCHDNPGVMVQNNISHDTASLCGTQALLTHFLRLYSVVQSKVSHKNACPTRKQSRN
ncbi:hypothetical protein Q5P01_015894 [Channa striata]|uniref:Uncharacterized protein n=1 Tax=Channa striata TaxID=64152 RepID=A0AA88MD05_CHASR|nr:hypothetical protein Q5P01_015894 [Channa striata]